MRRGFCWADLDSDDEDMGPWRLSPISASSLPAPTTGVNEAHNEESNATLVDKLSSWAMVTKSCHDAGQDDVELPEAGRRRHRKMDLQSCLDPQLSTSGSISRTQTKNISRWCTHTKIC